MKKVILTVMTLISLNGIGQINNAILTPKINSNDSMLFMKPRSAGDELQLASLHFYEGAVFTAVGGGLLATSEYVKHNNNSNIESQYLLIGFGSAISALGIGLILESRIHIKRAGILLNQNGIGLKININK